MAETHQIPEVLESIAENIKDAEPYSRKVFYFKIHLYSKLGKHKALIDTFDAYHNRMPFPSLSRWLTKGSIKELYSIASDKMIHETIPDALQQSDGCKKTFH